MSITDRVEEQLARIEADNPRLNAFTHVDFDGARRTARTVEGGSLAGVTVALKDNIAVAGMPWTGGLEGRRGLIAEQDAAVVRRLRAAGAIILGMLNQHEGALGATTDNPAYGRTLNPLGDGLTPGGSSGGAGAAAAAGMVDVAIGSDTMGSVRLPAAYCGVFGLKPTFGAVPRSGFLYLSPSLDTIGPLTRDPGMLWPVTSVMAGVDADDPDSLPAPSGWGAWPEASTLAGLTIGVPIQAGEVELEPAVRAGLDRAIDAFGEAGAKIHSVDLGGWDPHGARRAGLLVSEAEGAVEMADLIDRPGAVSPELGGMLRYGRDMPSGKLVRAWATVRAAGAACLRALAGVDVLLMPTASQRAFAFGDPVPENQADLTALANFAGCPAVAIPVGGDGLPASVQLLGPPWSEARLTRWAEALAPRLS